MTPVARAVFVLAATDPPGTKRARRLLAQGLARRGPRAGPETVVIVGAAHGDDPARLRAMSSALERDIEGATVAAPRLTDPDLDLASARAAIDRASVLYLDGGDTLELVAAVRSRGLLDAFTAAAARPTLIYGLSAGACAASPFTIGYDDDGDGLVAPCLDLGVPWPGDVHDEDDDWPELRALLDLSPPVAQGLAIPHDAAALVVGGKAFALAGAPELRSLERGAWRAEPLGALT